MRLKIKSLLLEHKTEHDLKEKVRYSEPEIYDANGDISKRWYVYFSFRNPATGYLERMPNIYVSQKLNTKQRFDLLKIYRKNLSEMLKENFNPFETTNPVETILEIEEEKLTIKEAFLFGINLKKQTQSETTHTNFKNRIKKFETWLNENGFENKTIDSITKKITNNYLNSILEKTSARNSDNTRLDLSSLFTVLEKNEIIKENIVLKIDAIGSTPVKNKPFTFDQEKLIFDYIAKNNLDLLYLYIQHISWSFFRPVECNRLTVADVILDEKIFHIKTKTGFKIKIIPDILLQKIPDLSIYPKDSFVFGFNGFGQYWEAKESNRRNHYNALFLEVKKAVGIKGREYGFYSFRHTNITRVYNNLIKEMTPDEAESRLMTFTQHATRDALRKYLREINAYRSEDYSKYFKK
ncbi:site-specific integrase [Flavobacterium sp. WC2509]|uniref:site-specific integrase n=1 Tax=Flavobacterium sp. WC2509 TaxID=3461406 RepID=UPI004044A5E0